MRLTLESQKFDKILVIRCKGRLAFGAEIEALEAEIYKYAQINGVFVIKDVVLQLAETEYIDSSELGTLIRLLGVLRPAGGGLKLCQLSQSVAKVIQVTNLETLFPFYGTEAQAIGAFSHRPMHEDDEFGSSKTRIVCIDTSSNLLAGLKALLARSGYGVFTTRYVGEALILVRAIGPNS